MAEIDWALLHLAKVIRQQHGGRRMRGPDTRPITKGEKQGMAEQDAKEEKQERMILELMSGSRFRLPPLALVTIDDPADLIALLGYWEGMNFSLTPDSKMNITLNEPGKLTIKAAIKMHDQGFVRHLLWSSTKVPGDVRWINRIEISHWQAQEFCLITSNYQSIQGWAFDPVPSYTLERMRMRVENER